MIELPKKYMIKSYQKRAEMHEQILVALENISYWKRRKIRRVMDIRQLQNERLVMDLLAKYQPIIDTIMVLVEGIDVMTQDDRLRWIHSRLYFKM